MKRRISFAEAAERVADHSASDGRLAYQTRLVAPPGGFLVRSSRGWLHHRIRWGFHHPHSNLRVFQPPAHTNWQTECGQLLLHSPHGNRPILIPISEVDFICGRCELLATEAGLPATTLLSEGVCEARRNIWWAPVVP